MQKVFADMENAIKNSNESEFKQHWLAEGYSKNLVGRSGLEGSRLFAQGSRKKWFLKPDYSKTVRQGKVDIYRCDVYSWEKDKSVDEVFLAVSADDLKVLGGGEDFEEVKKLAERFNAGAPLEASK